jgi:hypothetical protein
MSSSTAIIASERASWLGQGVDQLLQRIDRRTIRNPIDEVGPEMALDALIADSVFAS